MKKVAICEPSCQQSSHESFNSTYIYALCTVYPEVEFCFFAHPSHISVIRKYFEIRNIQIKNLSYEEISFSKIIDKTAKADFTVILNKIGEYLADEPQKNVFFTSVHPYYLNILRNTNFYCCCIIHGIESEFNKNYQPEPKAKPLLITRIKNLIKHPRSSLKKEFANIASNIKESIRIIKYERRFAYKDAFSLCDEQRFSFLFLSAYILDNLSKVIEVKKNFYSTPLLELQPDKVPYKEHSGAKFAVFGYGAWNNLFSQLAIKLNDMDIDKEYELRVVGMRVYPEADVNRHVVQARKFLPRAEMEEQIQDIDFFINFYTANEYKFGCSGSVIEAITYEKPVIYISNDCYNAYNAENKFGIECKDIDGFAEVVKDIITNWDSYKNNEYKVLKENILLEKNAVSVHNNLHRIREATSLWGACL